MDKRLDVSASYPNGGAVFNIAKETTKRELCRIQGISEEDQREQSINLSGGHVNAIEFCTTLFSMPELDTWLNAFEHDEGLIIDTNMGEVRMLKAA